MEILFENWRRKASLPENLIKEGNSSSSNNNNNNNNNDRKKNDLLKTAKSAYSLLKMFKVQSGDNNPKIKKTNTTKKFLKANSIETTGETCRAPQQQPQPEASEGKSVVDVEMILSISLCVSREG